jgi:hypothetical protein
MDSQCSLAGPPKIVSTYGHGRWCAATKRTAVITDFIMLNMVPDLLAFPK